MKHVHMYVGMVTNLTMSMRRDKTHGFQEDCLNTSIAATSSKRRMITDRRRKKGEKFEKKRCTRIKNLKSRIIVEMCNYDKYGNKSTTLFNRLCMCTEAVSCTQACTQSSMHAHTYTRTHTQTHTHTMYV